MTYNTKQEEDAEEHKDKKDKKELKMSLQEVVKKKQNENKETVTTESRSIMHGRSVKKPQDQL